MQFGTILFAIAFFFLPVFASPPPKVTVKYSGQYDNPDESLLGVACSNGANGLINKGFDTFGSLANFPLIGGAAAVKGWNSPKCGTCWRLSYKGKSINVLAIDHASEGFIISQEALDLLTNGQAVDLGHVKATASQISHVNCGI